MIPFVQIRVDLGGRNGIPHTFIAVAHPDGMVTEYGLVPANGLLYGTGIIEITGSREQGGAHEYGESTSWIPLSYEKYKDLMGSVIRDMANPPPYELNGKDWIGDDSEKNCTEWAISIWNEIGLPYIPGVTDPGIWNPYQQAIGIRRLERLKDADSLDIFLRDILDNFNDWAGKLLNGYLNDLYLRARAWILPRDPLALDLDGDGIETIGINGYDTVLFDHNGDGVKTGTGWVKSDDGFLVLDRNGNGLIDDGSELLSFSFFSHELQEDVT
jgi:hypothetical protein